jgi:HSP20 family protein
MRDLVPFFNRSSLSRSVFDEVDRALNDVFGRDFFPSTLTKSAYPKMNVYDYDNNLCFDIYVPQVSKDKIKIQIEDDVLTVSGESDADKKVNDDKYYFRELTRKSFSRSVQLPENVDFEKVSAEHKEGMLSIRIPYKGKKDEPTRVRKVDIA